MIGTLSAMVVTGTICYFVGKKGNDMVKKSKAKMKAKNKAKKAKAKVKAEQTKTE